MKVSYINECSQLCMPISIALRGWPILTTISKYQDFVRNEGRSNKTHLTFLSEGLESPIFRSYFTNWPKTVEPRLYEEGKEKVAGLVPCTICLCLRNVQSVCGL